MSAQRPGHAHIRRHTTNALDQRLEEERLRLRVGEVDATRQADGDSAGGFTQRAEQGELTWS
ncbi:hypothetical protein ABZT43_50520, partial [Streptomyces sp. NPDC005349]|uniref:hypothetical protein n=1 Tax=Streptomyces sp. NPDC005349 TaxID=3157037 RepID=UPI0033BF212F